MSKSRKRGSNKGLGLTVEWLEGRVVPANAPFVIDTGAIQAPIVPLADATQAEVQVRQQFLLAVQLPGKPEELIRIRTPSGGSHVEWVETAWGQPGAEALEEDALPTPTEPAMEPAEE